MDLSPTTLRTYRAQVEQIIRPRLKGKDRPHPADASPRTWTTCTGRLKGRGERSPKTIRNYHAIISSALHQGCPVGSGFARRRRRKQRSLPRRSAQDHPLRLLAQIALGDRAAEDQTPASPRAPPCSPPPLPACAGRAVRPPDETDVDLERCELDVSRSVVVVPQGRSPRRAPRPTAATP